VMAVFVAAMVVAHSYRVTLVVREPNQAWVPTTFTQGQSVFEAVQESRVVCVSGQMWPSGLCRINFEARSCD
jgi:hypothetical protein